MGKTHRAARVCCALAGSTQGPFHVRPLFHSSCTSVVVELLTLPARLSPTTHQLTLSSQMFLVISPILACTLDHKQHLEQLTPCAPTISWFTRQLVTRATTAPFSFSVLTENQHFILKEKKNNILSSHSELQHHLSCNQDIAELWCYKQTLLI